MAVTPIVATRDDIAELKDMISTLFEKLNALVVAHATCQTLTQQRIAELEEHARVIKGNGVPGLAEQVRDIKRVQEAHAASIHSLMDWYSVASLWVKRKMDDGDTMRTTFLQSATRWAAMALNTGIACAALYFARHGGAKP